MMPLELLDLCERKGCDEISGPIRFVMLRIARRPRGARMRLFSSRQRGAAALYGRVVGFSGFDEDGRPCTVVEVLVDDIRRWFRSNAAELERMAVSLAEEGKHEESAAWMAQYRAIEERLSAQTKPTTKGTE